MTQARQNQYNGVNAHFISAVQAGEAWPSFHAIYVIELLRVIVPALPEGYYALPEKSLQLREYTEYGSVSARQPRPDLTLYGPSGSVLTGVQADINTLVLPLEELADDELYFTAVVVHQEHDDAPVARLELLSPSNKSGSGLHEYARKRTLALKGSVNHVDIDLLHYLPSPIYGMPLYPDEPRSSAYSIAIASPHPTYAEGRAVVTGVTVDQTLPTLTVPLANDDAVTIDFDVPFQQAFELHFPAQRSANYAALPAHFDAYSPQDQARIQAVMARVQRAAATTDLNHQRVLT